MRINEIFVKSIDRDIKGVIKVGQTDDENIRQELDEYVITRDMQKHFADFFSSYKKGIGGNTDKMGVWISGFFGSGKSHFLKILSYLLANREIDGNKAIGYFSKDKKIADPMVLADITLAASVPTDVILFNIDSKNDAGGKQSKDAIVSVFLKVFNEMQGFCGSIPILANLERTLSEANRYDEFARQFENNYGKPWVSSRTKFDFIQDHVVSVLTEMNFMSEAAVRALCKKATEPYNISIEDFARLVKEYIDRKGNNHHVVFLVDEIGQYIGDDSKLMLNLQTMVEDLGTVCHGKVWVIVTSQQDIDVIAKDMGLRSNDFSKIQGRFDTRLSFSSADVDEVIKKRILEKRQPADETLRLLYEQKATIIKNLITFNDGVEKKLYADERDFSSMYPFVPYQFNLLGSVLTSIRKHGASGKHLSEGERSMLALFKESAMQLMDSEIGPLIPFNVFYDTLHQFLDHSHKSVISKALDNNVINPEREDYCYNINVLKTLFMIKYVKEITANVDNIVSLMADRIDADRIELKKRTEEALKILVHQTLVQKNGEVYVFLTDEEQEINREIEGQTVEMADVISKVSEVIFDDIFKDKKYRYSAFNGRYNFAFNQIVDDRPYKANQGNAIGVKVLTPHTKNADDETVLRMMSGQGKDVVVAIPNDSSFLEEIRNALKIEKYLRINTSGTLSKYEQIKEAKRAEMRERNGNAKLFLVEALKNADIYVNGDKMQIGTKDVSLRINEALSNLVATVYHKLSYIDTAMGDANIRSLFTSSKQQSLTLKGDHEPNANALRDVLSHITENSASHTKTSLKSLMDRFMKAPYGFVGEDVEWLVAKLFVNGDITFTVNGSSVTLLNKTADEIIRYITKREFMEKLLTERREKATDGQKKTVRELAKELFGVSSFLDDDDEMMQKFQQYSGNILADLEKHEIMQENALLPGKRVVASGKALFRVVMQAQTPIELFESLHGKRDDFLDFAEDYEPVKAFFNGEQKGIFEKAQDCVKTYDDSKNFFVNEQVEGFVTDMKTILSNESPYTDIPKLPELTDKFTIAYMEMLHSRAMSLHTVLNEAKERVANAIEGKPYKDEMNSRCNTLFEEIYKKLETCHNMAILQNIGAEADALKVRLLNEINAKNTQLSTSAASNVKKHRTISIKTIAVSHSWQIETTQDMDKYLAALRERILQELHEDTIINIEF